MSDSPGQIHVKCLDHVTLIVKDLDASRKFYVDALGMAEQARPAFSFDGLWFQAGDTQIHLILEHDESGPAGLGDSLPTSNRTHHFALQVDDAASLVPTVNELKIPIVSGPKERPDGAVQLFVADPDGHVVELCSVPKS